MKKFLKPRHLQYSLRQLGQSSGFEVMIEDINSYGPQKLQEITDELMLTGNQTAGLSTVQSMFSANVPQYYLNIAEHWH